MNVFIDTSSLIKLYHIEIGTEYLDKLFEEYSISKIYLSELTKIEFNSAIWKKVRLKELKNNEAKEIIYSFIEDYKKFTFIPLNSDLIESAQNLIGIYGIHGLRTLDSIQLASILKVKSELSFVITADVLLKTFIEKEGLKVK